MTDETLAKLNTMEPATRGQVTAYIMSEEKSVETAQILAFLLGGLGVHRFYLGHVALGFLYLIFCMTFIPMIVAFVEIFCMTGIVARREKKLLAKALLIYGVQ